MRGGGQLGSRLCAPQELESHSVLLPELDEETGPGGQDSQTDDVITGVSKLEAVARVISGSRSALLSQRDALASRLQMSRRRLDRCLAAVAEHFALSQRLTFQDLLAYLRIMQDANALKVQRVMHHVFYDETPMVLVPFSGSAGHDDLRLPQLCKVYAVEQSFRVVFKKNSSGPEKTLDNYVVLELGATPSIRVGGNATADTMMRVLQSTALVPYSQLTTVCASLTRIAETDEAPANLSCEHKLRMASASCYHKAQVVCSAHKIHAIAQKSWPFWSNTVAGILSTLKLLTRHGALQAFVKALELEILERVVFTKGPLPPEALRYRQHVMELWTPSCKDMGKSAVTLRCFATFVLSGDWRVQAKVEHRCLSGCCNGREDFDSKVKHMVPRVVKALTVKIMNRSDWRSWHAATNLIGFWMSLHGLFALAFQRVFAGTLRSYELEEPAVASGEDPGGDDDKMAQFRREFGQDLKKAAACWSSGAARVDLHILRATLLPETILMAETLERTSGPRLVQQKMQCREGTLLGQCLDNTPHSFGDKTDVKQRFWTEADPVPLCLRRPGLINISMMVLEAQQI